MGKKSKRAQNKTHKVSVGTTKLDFPPNFSLKTSVNAKKKSTITKLKSSSKFIKEPHHKEFDKQILALKDRSAKKNDLKAHTKIVIAPASFSLPANSSAGGGETILLKPTSHSPKFKMGPTLERLNSFQVLDFNDDVQNNTNCIHLQPATFTFSSTKDILFNLPSDI